MSGTQRSLVSLSLQSRSATPQPGSLSPKSGPAGSRPDSRASDEASFMQRFESEQDKKMSARTQSMPIPIPAPARRQNRPERAHTCDMTHSHRPVAKAGRYYGLPPEFLNLLSDIRSGDQSPTTPEPPRRSQSE